MLDVECGATTTVRSMEFKDVIAKRRMVRNYTDEPVTREALERILDAGRKAPSAGFSQGHAFVVATDEADRQAIAELADETAYVAMGLDPWISGAPAHIIVCVSEAAYHRRYNDPTSSTAVKRSTGPSLTGGWIREPRCKTSCWRLWTRVCRLGFSVSMPSQD